MENDDGNPLVLRSVTYSRSHLRSKSSISFIRAVVRRRKFGKKLTSSSKMRTFSSRCSTILTAQHLNYFLFFLNFNEIHLFPASEMTEEAPDLTHCHWPLIHFNKIFIGLNTSGAINLPGLVRVGIFRQHADAHRIEVRNVQQTIQFHSLTNANQNK